ncbi:MAG: hypothetical protein LUG88_02655, partial [Clostridia bacterium]|nr:hypothetical protein [Clostridia bacterium]
RLLGSGDASSPRCNALNGGLLSWTENLVKIHAYRNEFDVLYGGGGRLEKKLFDAFLECVRYAWDHEGVLLPPPTPRKPRFTHEDPEGFGRTVYDRRMPHPGDGASYPDESETLRENLRRVEYAGTSIVYDLTKKYE